MTKARKMKEATRDEHQKATDDIPNDLIGRALFEHWLINIHRYWSYSRDNFRFKSSDPWRHHWTSPWASTAISKHEKGNMNDVEN